MGEWAKIGEDVRDGDRLIIKDGGTLISGKFGDQIIYRVQTRTGDKNMSFNQTTINNLIDAFSDETENWIGKEVHATIVRVMIGGELKTVAYLAAEGWIMDNKGKFQDLSNVVAAIKTTGNATSSEPVIQLDNNHDINPDDIPF